MKFTTQVRRVLVGGIALFAGATSFGAPGCGVTPPPEPESVETTSSALARSLNPPGGLSVSQVPQFVAVTFDDNFNVDGMTWATNFLQPLTNPAGTSKAATYDGTAVRTSFYHNSTYLQGMQSAWQTAFNAGHELDDHTVNHPDGIAFTTSQWTTEIHNCRTALASGLGTTVSNIKGFRSPYLHYNDNTFAALLGESPAFTYDTSIMGCWATGEGPTNCPWPYTMESGSADADAVFNKWSGRNVVSVSAHAGLWEMPVSVVFVPPDSVASQYGFTAGLRDRVNALIGGAQNPNFFELSTGKMVGMDITMVLDARMSKAEALATLKYTLDQRLAGNRAPMIFVGHTHVYEAGWNGNAPNVSDLTERRGIIQDFVNYALTKPDVRIRPVIDIVTWMNSPAALGGGCTPESDSAFCSRLGKNCDSVTANDNCGTSRTVSSCGTCTSPQTCGGGGTANVCGNSSNPDRTEGGTVTATGSPCNSTTETPAKAYDNLMTSSSFSKWCVTSAPSTSVPISTMYDFSGTTLYAITSYTITTGNDVPGRDPKNWTFQGCQGTCTVGSDTGWVTLDTQTNQFAGAARYQTNTFSFTNGTAYQQYRLRVTANNGDTSRFQLAEIQEFGSAGTCTPESDSTFCSRLGKNCGSVAANDNCGTSRTVSSCGTCTSPQTCGGGGTANVCGSGGGPGSPTVTSYTLGKCNATVVYNAKLYKCISQAAGVNGEPTGCGTAGVYCSNITPTDPAWGTTAWQFLQDCP
jgi:hypothetical protein